MARSPGSLRVAITHFGGLQIAPFQTTRTETQVVTGGLTQDDVDILAYVDKEIERIVQLIVSVSVALLSDLKPGALKLDIPESPIRPQ
jgi:hypothetical protein